MYRSAVVALGILIAVSPAQAQDVPAAIDSIFSFATPETPGCAVGVSHQGREIANRAYGLATLEPRVPLAPGSIFDIGSTQKQFVAAAVLLLVEEGRLALTDAIRTVIPELQDYGHPVTVDHLLTHTSGMRDWTGLLPMAPEGTDVLDLILRQRALNFVPGEQWSYSNSGYVLLKEIVGRVSGMSFADFARTRLFEPLGMTSTAYVPDILEGGPGVALGYQKEGAEWRPFMRLGNARGGGAIISTTADLLAWNVALTEERLGAFVTGRLQEQTRLDSGRRLTYARGLIVEDFDGVAMVSHSGGAAGYSTWLGRFPGHALSVVVMCNFDPVSASALAGRVSDLFLPPPAATEPDRGPEEAADGAPAGAGGTHNGMAGLFLHEQTGDPIRLGVNQGRLQVAGGPPLVAGPRVVSAPEGPACSSGRRTPSRCTS